MVEYGYVRVSSPDQNPDRQILALLKYVKRENIVVASMVEQPRRCLKCSEQVFYVW